MLVCIRSHPPTVMNSRQIGIVISRIGVFLLVVGALLLARDIISSFRTENLAPENGSMGFAHTFHFGLVSIAAGIGGMILIIISVWLPKRP